MCRYFRACWTLYIGLNPTDRLKTSSPRDNCSFFDNPQPLCTTKNCNLQMQCQSFSSNVNVFPPLFSRLNLVFHLTFFLPEHYKAKTGNKHLRGGEASGVVCFCNTTKEGGNNCTCSLQLNNTERDESRKKKSPLMTFCNGNKHGRYFILSQTSL